MKIITVILIMFLSFSASADTRYFNPGTDQLSYILDGDQTNEYEYDANGNVVRIGNRIEKIFYDPHFDKPTSVNGADDPESQYHVQYGGLGNNRVRKEYYDEEAKRVRSAQYHFGGGSKPLSISYNDSSDPNRQKRSHTRLIYGPTGLIATDHYNASTVSSKTNFIVKNNQGSTVLVKKPKGVFEHFSYTPTGKIHKNGATEELDEFSDVPYLFQGQEYDWQTKTHDFKARIYDPRTMTFLAHDPAPSAHESPYVGLCNDPINNLDPDGRSCVNLKNLKAFSVSSLVYALNGLMLYGMEAGGNWVIPSYAATVALGGIMSYPLISNSESLTVGPRDLAVRLAMGVAGNVVSSSAIAGVSYLTGEDIEDSLLNNFMISSLMMVTMGRALTWTGDQNWGLVRSMFGITPVSSSAPFIDKLASFLRNQYIGNAIDVTTNNFAHLTTFYVQGGSDHAKRARGFELLYGGMVPATITNAGVTAAMTAAGFRGSNARMVGHVCRLAVRLCVQSTSFEGSGPLIATKSFNKVWTDAIFAYHAHRWFHSTIEGTSGAFMNVNELPLSVTDFMSILWLLHKENNRYGLSTYENDPRYDWD